MLYTPYVTLSLIQGCNFGCVYCYQGGESTTHDKSKILTSRKSPAEFLAQLSERKELEINTAEILTFLKSQCIERHVKKLHFTADGGEPLLNKEALLEIVSAMGAYCRKRGIFWIFDMVSNGSLLNKKTVLELKKYGFVQVQVTINGNKETHDASRPFLNVKGKEMSTEPRASRRKSLTSSACLLTCPPATHKLGDMCDRNRLLISAVML